DSPRAERRSLMTFLSAFQVALDALLVNKGRSALTSLGIVIGISAVIAMVSAGNGARRKLDNRLENVGKNLILIRAGSPHPQGMVADYVPLTMADRDAIRKAVGPLLVGVAPSLLTQRVASSHYGRTLTAITGSVPDLQPVRNWRVIQGRFYSEDDVKQG